MSKLVGIKFSELLQIHAAVVKIAKISTLLKRFVIQYLWQLYDI